MNKYLKNLNRIEFVVTYACTGMCKHCSESDHKSCGERIDPKNPYMDDPCNVKCLSFEPNGDVLDSNVYEYNIMEIVNNYLPRR